MLTNEEAGAIIDYLESLEEQVRHDVIMDSMNEKGYKPEEVDSALKALGKIAGRDCGIF